MNVKLWMIIILVVASIVVIIAGAMKKIPGSVMKLLVFLAVMGLIIYGIGFLIKKLQEGSSWN